MIISTLIALVCFIVVIAELLSMYQTFKSCCKVKCSVISSRKIQERKDGFLTDEYFKTKVDFTYRNLQKSTSLKTSTYCQKGQILACYYYPNKDIIFRKRDLKNQFKKSSLVVTTTGILFMFLNILFRLTVLSRLFKHLVGVLSVLLIAAFLGFGVGFISYSVYALKRTSKANVTKIEAQIVDVIRKSKKHNENEQFTYYPIYRYTFKGIEHETKSKLKHNKSPVIGSCAAILVDNKKAGPVEYNDVKNSMILGFCFIFFALLFIYVILFTA